MNWQIDNWVPADSNRETLLKSSVCEHMWEVRGKNMHSHLDKGIRRCMELVLEECSACRATRYKRRQIW